MHADVIDAFANTLAAELRKTFKYGSVWDKSVNFGPLYASNGINKVKAHLEDAVERGAKVHSGGLSEAQNSGPNFFPPTIVTDATAEMLFASEETFGPLAFLVPFQSEEEVILIANDTSVGRAAYFYTESISRMWRAAEKLKVGMVGARVGLVSAAEQPFGGVYESGLGREGGSAALQEYLDVKSITMAV